LGFYSQRLALLLANLELLFHHNPALDRHIVLGLDVFQRRCLVASLALEVVALYLDIPQLELERSLSIAQCCNLFL
jgi:hypothetical protein